MAKTITQKVIFKNTPAAVLYDIYMDPRKHSAVIGGAVTIAPKEGTAFAAHGKYITGKTLQLIKNKLIVQSWRASDWGKAELDSTFILRFEQVGKDGVITMVHANIPDKHVKSIKDGWNKFYWHPWKEYLAG